MNTEYRLRKYIPLLVLKVFFFTCRMTPRCAENVFRTVN